MPKCPIPVFFKFDIEEVLAKYPDCCYYSDRNMQSDNPNVYKIKEVPEKLGTEYLYKTMEDAYLASKRGGGYDRETHMYEINQVMKYSQQEFLIESEFDFSNLKSFRIICYDKFYADLLKQIFAEDPISEKIFSSENETDCIFEYENRRLKLKTSENAISLSTDFQDEYYFKVAGENLSGVEFDLSNCDVLEDNGHELKLRGLMVWKKSELPFDVYFVDPNARTKKWLIYQNAPLDTIESSKLLLDNSLKIVISQFKDYVDSLPLQISSDLFYPSMLHSSHGIAHTYRVLFNSFLIAYLSNVNYEDLRACGIAAIIHDLGKCDDREGQAHGEKSVLRCAELVKSCVHDDYRYNEIMSAVKYHSIPDEITPNDVRDNFIWKTLKDADALDRSRFYGKGCDISYLRLPVFRSEEGQNIIDLTSLLPGWTTHLKWIDPTAEFIDTLSKFIK